MASLIKVKRSSTPNSPNTLSTGELAYSFGIGLSTNAGDRLFIGGMGPNDNLNYAEGAPIVVGGKYFTDMMDHTKGVLTVNSALITDASGKLDELKVDSLNLNAGTLSAIDALIDSGNIRITPVPEAKTIITNIFTYKTPTALDPISLEQYIQETVTGGIGTGQIVIQDEKVQDIVGGMITGTGSLQDGLSIVYNDDDGKLRFDVNDPTIQISGDATASQQMVNLGNVNLALTLATVNTTVGSFPDSNSIVNNAATKVPVITVNAKGLVTSVTTADIASSLTIKDDANSTEVIQLLTESLSIVGGEGIDTAVSANTITISGEDATYTNKGIASFNSTNFSVTGGAVSTTAITLGTTSVNNGGTTINILGLTSLGVGNLNIAGNTISVPDNTNGNIILDPNGVGTVDVSLARITNVAAPVDPLDAVNKSYVDAARSGLDVKGSVRAATTQDIVLSNTQTIDGVALANNDRVLVKNQTDKTLNGLYVVNSNGAWSRSGDAATSAQVTSGLFTFVQEGLVNGDSGFVLITNDPIVLGTTELEFALFSTSGTLIAGSGLAKVGDTLSVGAGAGITVTADAVQLATSVAGSGLTLTNGVLNVVGTASRITANADSIDIASDYVGQTSITTLGTITAGTWNGNVITVPYGGTGVSTFTQNGVIFGNGTNNLLVTASGTYDADNTMGQLLMVGPTGAPVWTNKVDGGIY